MERITFKWIVVVLVMTLISGCSVLGTYMDPNHPETVYHIHGKTVRTSLVEITPDLVANQAQPSPYRVGAYDRLGVTVWDHPELNSSSSGLIAESSVETELPGSTTVAPVLSQNSAAASFLLVGNDGTITYPLAGTFKVAGYTISQIQRIFAQRLSKYIRNPRVTVQVTQFRSKEIQVLGEVGARKTLSLEDKPVSLFDALSQSGETNPISADTANILVIRGTLAHLTIYRLDAKSPQMMMAAEKFYMRNNDIIYVPPVTVTNWKRLIGQVLPFMGSATETKSAVMSLG